MIAVISGGIVLLVNQGLFF